MYSSKKYANFAQLRENEREGIDYGIEARFGRSDIAVLAPHGGNIEPDTSEIASATAGAEHSFYSFKGLKRKGNWVLHLPSVAFDEPTAMRMARRARTLVTIHGCEGDESCVYMGGLHRRLKEQIAASLRSAGFQTREKVGLRGMSQRNLCNQCRMARGVQLEITAGLRRTMFQNIPENGKRIKSPVFCRFVSALRRALSMPCD